MAWVLAASQPESTPSIKLLPKAKGGAVGELGLKSHTGPTGKVRPLVQVLVGQVSIWDNVQKAGGKP